MKYLVFLLWIPAFLILYLSIHQEIVAERTRRAHETGSASAHAEDGNRTHS